MPRTALRYAIEKMPADLKAEAMKKVTHKHILHFIKNTSWNHVAVFSKNPLS